ncbi:hypothetical protein RchiOBHm_Chr7g0193551 [Rosa chinensis]|uniref:Uncharacterized protein n=1 Tax=Rosa chinensis TaxID=74649 RepID=A0A2P6P5U8_ROSCH|nr:uncharacterized protein LOC112180164 [Rosa chinensis]PRQ17308.1 hypothetical protein RchiOBHm_Chr7g0193551 [Rosa chinensis]
MQTSSAAASSLTSLSPSFNAYSSSDSLAQIAARVVSEFRQELDEAGLEDIDDLYDNNNDAQFSPPRLEAQQEAENDHVKEAADEEEEEEEFEFAFVCREGEAPTSPIAAEEVFYNGQIRPVYPVFDQSLLLQNDDDLESDSSHAVNTDSEMLASTVTKPRRQPLRMLMIEEEREAASCSSSEADDLENLPPGTYCVWAPPKASRRSGGGGGCDKSSSTGSSKRWKFRDLLSRSSSDGGKDTLVFFAPTTTTKTAEKEGSNVVVARKGKSSKAVADGDKRRSFLPYRQDLVGFFSNVNGLSRNLHPF